jgi:short subunit dehydrogenase-like uncharacterized protein
MNSKFLLYGANGFVGQEIARLAVQQGLHPVLAGRNAPKIRALAEELGLDWRVFRLEDSESLDQALRGLPLVLHVAGPYLYSSEPMVEGCLRNCAHYLDITGEIPVYAALAGRDAEATARNVMILPGVGFDVVPTDCLASHLHQRLPTATHLNLAFCSEGSVGLPPGTANTLIEMIRFGDWVREKGQLVATTPGSSSRLVDFGNGPRQATRLNWGDAFMAFYSTGIPNIADYMVLPPAQVKILALSAFLRPIFKLRTVREIFKHLMPSGSTAEQRLQARTHVWGEAFDDQGRVVVSRLHGPEAGVIWTGQAALGAVKRVLAGAARPGFQTPSQAFGAEFVLEHEGVTREDVA